MNLLCRIFGHKYEARYHFRLGAPALPEPKLRQVKGAYSFTQVLDASREREETYVCDICSRCGEITNAGSEELQLEGLGSEHTSS